MKRTIACVNMLVAVVAFMIDCQLLSAQTVVINETDRGWYREPGTHFPANPNYFVGDNRGTTCGGGSTCDDFRDYRNFFAFDLSNVVSPIASAKLALTVPGAGYSSSDPSENYEVHDVVTSITSLLNGTGGSAAWNDLGSGVVYGNRTMTAADMGTVVEIKLNSSAIAAMNATHGLFGIGGSLMTLDNLSNDEYVFAFANVPGDTHIGISELRLTLVPEPSTLLLLGFGAISLLGYRKAKSQR
jgi:hypothetical protein